MKEKILPYTKYLLLFTGILFLILGVIRKEHTVVLTKAVRICLECIGIG